MPGDAETEPPRRRPEVVLGVCGGVAAYKAADLCSKMVQGGYAVTVVFTEAATHFVGPATFEALTGRVVRRDGFRAVEHPEGEHIGLGRKADLLVVAPATAGVIGRLANGLAEDLLTTTALVATCPKLFAPAMNVEMWDSPSVRRNAARLVEDGWTQVGPEEGWLSCGVVGAGRLSAPVDILKRIRTLCPADSGESA